jgi:hypothetical protein
MAWSPPALKRRDCLGSAPGDYAIFNSNHIPDGTQAQRGPIYQHPPIWDRADVARYTATVLEGL